jgi:hypothetical protein
VTLSEDSRNRLTAFVGTSVTVNTAKTYERNWKEWCTFIRDEAGGTDPYLSDWAEEDKGLVVALFLHHRHCEGKRGKEATAPTAGIRFHFTTALMSTAFLDSPVITAARASCKPSTAEARLKRDGAPSASVKLPMWEGAVIGLRSELVDGKGWGQGDIDGRMVYVAIMWGYNMAARVSEYTAPEKGGEDHCVRARDLSFHVLMDSGEIRTVKGGDDFFTEARGLQGTRGYIQACWVGGGTQKTSVPVKAKCIGRRTPEESQFLDDLVEWIIRSGISEASNLFSRRVTLHRTGRVSLKNLSASMVREQIKATARKHGLNEDYFSTHSLRKAAITHMRAKGVSGDDMRDRGGYAEGT